ncbi:Multidrug resistance protein MdtC [compost metagenome]
MIGILLLMGIVKKNSILLIDFTNAVRKRKDVKADEALKEACPIRLRPIIMTSFATIAAAIPSAIATGAGSETFKPMAITLIGGVFVSTLLTLYVVPVVYSLVDRFRHQDTRRKEVEHAFEVVGNATTLTFKDMPEIIEDKTPPEVQPELPVNVDSSRKDRPAAEREL